jgi:hypothetical protein
VFYHCAAGVQPSIPIMDNPALKIVKILISFDNCVLPKNNHQISEQTMAPPLHLDIFSLLILSV